MINRRFLNFKTYNGFLSKKREIPEDAIVFIQDKPCIWAHGKEYICDGPYTSAVTGNTLLFKNGNDKTLFTISLNDGNISFTDADGNTSNAAYVSKDYFNAILSQLNSRIDDKADVDSLLEIEDSILEIQLWKDQLGPATLSYVRRDELDNLAFTGEYTDIKDRPINNVMVTLSVDEYQYLVDNDLVDQNVYYFTYEKTTWEFGDKFPIILTEGSTPDSIGTFPINLA